VSHPHLHAVLRHAGALAAAHADPAPDADLLARFAADRDGDAFAALVRRHGPMVWGVCRNLLPSDADAEDAFQATFLALLRSADKVRDASRLSGWLHGVAVRIALKARRAAAHRRRRERAAAGAEAEPAAPVPDAAWDELLAAVHEEVQRLPAALREAFVLCGLEGVRQPDAAARLGCKPGTLTARLARARRRLLAGLARRGIAPATAAGAVGAAAVTGASAPAALTRLAAGLARSTGPIAPSVLYLAQGVLDMNARTKWLAAALLAAVGLATTIGTAVISSAPAQPPPRGGTGGGARPPEAAPRGMGGGFAGPMTRGWEYKLEHGTLNRSDAEQELNKLGEQGWELCATGERGAVVFKRPKGMPMAGGAFGGGGGFSGGGIGGFGAGPAGGGAGVPDALIENYIRRFDTNGDGKISREEAAENERLKALFDTIDANKDGFIDAAEYRKYLESRGARAGGPAGGAGPAGRAGEVQVFALKNADAVQLATLLKEVFGRTPGVNASADQRTNSLVVTGDAVMLKTVRALVERLDQPDGGPGPRRR
jgi:RNA polymerase sigma factor (sigma-70 family)